MATKDGKKHLVVTHVDAVGNYLRVYGLTNPEAMQLLQQKMQNFLVDCMAIDPTWPIERHEFFVQEDSVCLFKSVNSGGPSNESEFMRVRVLKKTGVTGGPRKYLRVEAEFIDYGYKKEVRSYELLIPNQSELLKKIPPLCNDYILLGICGDWSSDKINDIKKIVKGHHVEISIVYELYQEKFIKMKWKGFDFVEYLILHVNVGGGPVADELLLENFQRNESKTPQLQPQTIKQINGIAINDVVAPTAVANSRPTLNNNNYKNLNKNFINSKVFSPSDNNNIYHGKNVIHDINSATSAFAQRKSLSARLRSIQVAPPRHAVPPYLGTPAVNRPTNLTGSPGIVTNGGAFMNRNVPNLYQPQPQQNLGLAAYYSAAIMRQRQPYVVPAVRFTAQPIQPFPLAINKGAFPSAQPAVNLLQAANKLQQQQQQIQQLQKKTLINPAAAAAAAATILTPAKLPTSLTPGPKATTSPRRTTFKTQLLTVGQSYDVVVSYVENGPLQFYIQLVSAQYRLSEMMNAIEREEFELRRLTISPNKPYLGACMARYSEDNHLYRALILSVQQTSCKVAYIDYGNSEMVTFNNLYEIPEKFLEEKTFAIPFCLSGSKNLGPIDDSIKKTFAERVTFKPCKLNVVPLEGPPVLQYCQLINGGEDMLNVLNRFISKRNVYPKADNLNESDVVEIRYIDSPKRFFVQKVANIKAFDQLMDEMFTFYNKNQVVPKELHLGDPCIVKCENDWYRGEVIKDDNTAIIIRHVDFGYEQKVTRNLLSVISPKHLKMPRQAVQCCLKGFENNDMIKDLATTQFEMLAEDSQSQRRAFSVKVFRIEPNGVNLVNLFTKELNVMKKLYKLSMPFADYLILERSEFNASRKQGKGAGSGAGAGAGTDSASGFGINGASSSTGSVQKSSNKLNSNSVHSDNSSKETDKSKTSNISKQQQQQQNKANENNRNQNQKQFPNQSQQQQQQQQQRGSNKNQNQNQKNKENMSVGQNVGGALPAAPPAQGPQPLLSLNIDMKKPSKQQFPRSPEKFKENALAGGNVDNVSLHSSLSAGSFNKSQRSAKSNNSANKSPRHNNRQHRDTQKVFQRPRNGPEGYSHSPINRNSPRKSKASATNQGQVAASATTTAASAVSPSPSTSSRNSDKTQKEKQVKVVEEYLPLDQAFAQLRLKVPSTEEVVLTWWVSPYQFYTLLKSNSDDYENLCAQLEDFYKDKPIQQFKIKNNSSVVIYNRKDKIYCRGRVLGCNHMVKKYKIFCVDTGRQLLVCPEDIWQVEKRFAQLPCLAHECSFKGIISNYDHLHIISIMTNYLPQNAHVVCEYYKYQNSIYYVNVRINKHDLKDKLITNGILSPVDSEMKLELLAGQQVRAKFTSISDMLHFKISLVGCDPTIKLLCSYDDVRYVKSNTECNQKFKDFYEDQTFVVNIKSVNEHKVVFLRPLMPLFKEDIASYIPTCPIILRTFHCQFLNAVSPHRLFCVAQDRVDNLKKLKQEMNEFYENSGENLKVFEKDSICAAKGKDNQWYRGRIKAISQKNDKVEVFYMDNGLTETQRRANLKVLNEKFYVNSSAFAIELNLPIRTNIDLLHSSKKFNDTKNESDLKIERFLEEHLRKPPTLLIEVFEVRNNRLIGDLLIEEFSLIEALVKQKLIIGKDIDYMRKVLDKEKPNVLEYIEMVDLTLEDEEESQHKPKQNDKKLVNGEKEEIKENGFQNEEKVPDPLEKRKESLDVFSVEKMKELQIEIPEMNGGPTTSTPNSMSQEKFTPVSVEDPYADMEQAVLSHCDNPAQFFIHPQDRIEELYKLQENLQIVATSLPALICVANGANCIAPYSVTGQWCRAKILDAELLVLRYTDFGNTDWISDSTEIKEMSVFPDIEPFCIPCALPIRPNGSVDWIDAANAIFNDSYLKKLYFEYITHGDYEKKSYIRLFIDGVNVADKLVKDGFAKHLVLVDSGECCYISHLNNISDFYIQYEKNSKALELIECYLADVQNLKPFEDFEEGKIVAALFPDDEMWYRAKLLAAKPDGGFEVLFIDYGNTSISPECREISEDIASLPPLSIRCALDVPEDCVAWSEAAEEKFSEISATGETVFTVELVEPAKDRAIVHLFIDGANVEDDLRSLCELKPLESEPDLNASFGNTTLQTTIYESDTLYDALVSHINSLDDFYIQFEKNSERLSDVSASLNSLALEPLEDVEIGDICAVTFEGKLYRARIIEKLSEKPDLKCRCVLVDYGNDLVANSFRALPQDLEKIQDLAKHCQLYSSLYTDGTREALDSFLVLLEECNFIVKVNILNNEILPASVKLFNASDEDLGERLNKVLASKAEKEEAAKLCVISHTISPQHFYLQMKANSNKMDLIIKGLKDLKESEEKTMLKDPCVDELCCFYSTEDDCLYRGKIEAIEGKSFKVFLIDYGNTLQVDEIFKLPADLQDIAGLATKCSLLGFEKASFDESFLVDKFNDLLERHFGEVYELVEDHFDSEENIHKVRLQVKYNDLLKQFNDSLRNQNGEEKVIIPVLHNCHIVYTKSPQSFYIQFEEDLQAVEDLHSTFAKDSANYSKPAAIKEGDIVAAYSEEFDGYYRAKILAPVDEDKYAIHFIDYGNDGVTDQILELPEDLLALKTFARHCSLGHDSHVSSLEFKENFSEYMVDRFAQTFQIEFINKDAEPMICRLFFEDKDVAEEVNDIIRNMSFLDAQAVPLPSSSGISSTDADSAIS